MEKLVTRLKKFDIKKVFSPRTGSSQLSAGYTLVELLLVVGIIGILITLITGSLTNYQVQSNVTALTSEVIAEMKEQQTRAMSGDTDGTADSMHFGVHFDSDKYVLFRGTIYSPVDTANISMNLPEQMEFSNITFPGGDVIFSRVSGEVSGYTPGADSVTIMHKETDEKKVMRLNKLGVVSEVL